nr:copia protein [Tanacetum cinerariifolium]
MSFDTKLTKDEEYESVDSTKYRGMICSLLYLTTSRPDIMFSVYLCVRFQEAPKTSHLEAIKRIFQYIKGTTHLGLWYPKGTRIEIVVYAKSDHARDYVDRKSTSGICTFMGCCLTSWFSKKQIALAISTTKSEYISVEKACQQALYMKHALIDYDVRLDDVLIMCDNKGAIKLSKNPVEHSRNKHIEICHHFLRDNVQKGHISIEKVSSVNNIADILTKPIKRESLSIYGACVFIDKWSLDELAYGVPMDDPYQTNLPSPVDIISYIQIDREGKVCRIRHEEGIDVHEHQILTREIMPTLKPLEENIQENVLYSISPKIWKNEWSGSLNKLGEFYLMSERLERIVAREEVITLLLLPPPSTNHRPLILTMTMMEMAKGPHVQALLLPFALDEDVTTTPSPTTTSSSPTPPNAPSKTPSTNQTSSSQENTSFSFQSKLQILPPSSNEPTSPQPLNPLLDKISDIPLRPSNPQPLQSHSSLDITLSLSPITPLDHILDTPSPPSPQPQPQPQPPLMDGPWTEYVSGGMTLLRISSTKHKERPLRGHRIVGVESEVMVLNERVAELDRDNRRLRGTTSVKSQRVNRLQHDMSPFMTHEEVKELVACRVAEEIEAREAARNLETLNENGDEQNGEN